MRRGGRTGPARSSPDPRARAGVGCRRGRGGRGPPSRSTHQPPSCDPLISGQLPSAVRTTVVLLSALAVAACGGSDRAGGSDADRDDAWRGVRIGEPVSMPGATLTDTRGRPYDLREEARGRVTLLFFGYTHCPDVCPVQMANLGSVLERMPPSERRWIRVVFVTVDPRRDTAARLRRWLDRFGDGFVGLRGDSARVAELQRRLRLPPAARQDRSVRGRYTVGHASQVLAFGPDGRARLAYPSGTRQRDWAHDLPRLARRARSSAGSTPARPGG